MTAEYKTSHEQKALNIINVYELEDLAEALIPKGAFDYIKHGSGDEFTLNRNVTAWDHQGILPRVLADVENPDVTTSILGTNLRAPFVMAPIAAHGLAHASKEAGTAQAFAEFGSIMTISSYSGQGFAEIQTGLKGAPNWFQLYMSQNDEFNKEIIDVAKENGASAIILTADTTITGNREVDLRNKFVYPFGLPLVEQYLQKEGDAMSFVYEQDKHKISINDVRFLVEYSGLPVLVKGIQTPEDALKAIGAGAAGVWVSNHGGRQLDGAPASFDVLAEIAEAVAGRVPIIFDSGIRRGEHIFKALASGADIVALGRPILYGLALGGWQGVNSVLEYFEKDLKRVMQLAGTQTIADVKKTRLYDMKY